VKMGSPGGENWTWTTLFYNDELTRTEQGWRIVKRYEELVYPDALESPAPGSA